MSDKQFNLPLKGIDILNLLPHRYPFLLVDLVTELSENHAIAFKNVSFNEPFFMGHFPNRPIMPGVLIVEALAQLSCILFCYKNPAYREKIGVFSGIDNLKFKKPVLPGDILELKAEILWEKKQIGKLSVKALVKDELALTGEITCAMVNPEQIK